MFQSQARSQSPGDRPYLATRGIAYRFQSQARSQSPGDKIANRYRERLFVFQSQARSQSPGDSVAPGFPRARISVSISGEKPIPWRQDESSSDEKISHLFQSQARSQSPGDVERLYGWLISRKFQSQARSQSPGDWFAPCAPCDCHHVSISGEKPIPWRRAE